jgi:hypothetical protein
MDPLATAAAALGPLLKAYWVLAAGSVVATLLPVPLPQAFKCARLLIARASPAVGVAFLCRYSRGLVPVRSVCSCRNDSLQRRAL